jgi:hypothetical protein
MILELADFCRELMISVCEWERWPYPMSGWNKAEMNQKKRNREKRADVRNV